MRIFLSPIHFVDLNGNSRHGLAFSAKVEDGRLVGIGIHCRGANGIATVTVLAADLLPNSYQLVCEAAGIEP